MKKIENTKISYNTKAHNNNEISIPLIWIVFPLIIILLVFFSFNISARGTEKLVNNEMQSEVIEENVIEIENNTLSVGIDNNEETENTVNKQEIEIEETIEQPNNINTDNSDRVYTASNGETYSIIGILNIPTLNIKYDILSTSSTALLNISLNRYWGAYPNEVGNMVIVGHNYKNNKFFSNLSKINIGDIVKITDNTGKTLDYAVYDTDVIDPYDNSCTSQLTDGRKEITLITCYYENGNTHATKRFIVKARAN